jgi:uncharacterized membrane protein YfcA
MIPDLLAAGAAALAAGLVNALAGGGSLVTFPVLVALGLPPVVANVTNTVALCPGYLGATLAQRRALAAVPRGELVGTLAASVAGGLGGAALLLASGARFAALVPYLILLAAALLAIGEPLRRWLIKRGGGGGLGALAIPACGAAAIYGGYFGAGMGVMVLALLGLTRGGALGGLNALKQAVALATNVAAAALFIARGEVAWPVAATMAAFALVGGALGGRLADRIPAAWLRGLVVVGAVAIAVGYLVRG